MLSATKRKAKLIAECEARLARVQAEQEACCQWEEKEFAKEMQS